ncbi:hypothetical protein CPJCM30710_02010 [Clostridium polyendosporum]|uniref:ECF transporter S component n=1 Tax=Clostridium polyendosporum TaxID=69208 RepID=A0A919RY11_9CLOT|nr:ECF transporter S component [Clostridium polyendosporum]GIM27535.1 hypothetical protein CPJCM30710_02010 [Clostridium polyendosporum]
MENTSINKAVKASLFLAIAIIFQILGRNIPQINQFLVGPVVNAVLILTVYICDTKWGVLTGILTPVLAWFVGQLLTPLAPFIPFIAIGNAIYVIFFGGLKKYKFGIYISIISGSFAKFIFLSFASSNLVHLFKLNIPEKYLDKLVISMGVPQLITGIIGGIISAILIQILLKRKIIHTF